MDNFLLYFLDYFFSWIPFYFDFKLFVILYSSIKLDKLFKKPTDTELDVQKWTDKWIKNYCKWAIFWLLYAVFHVIELLVEVDEDDFQLLYYAAAIFVFISKCILKLTSGLFTSALFKFVVKPAIGRHEEKLSGLVDSFEDRVHESQIFMLLQRAFHWYIKRWKQAKLMAKEVKSSLKTQ